jgi:hypothetical protein
LENEGKFFRERAKEDLLSFCVLTDRFFEVNKHHKTLSNALTRFFRGETKYLILQTPPRS